MVEPSFSVGIEEEYLLVDRDTLDLVAAPQALMDQCRAELADQVSPEFLQCQVEIGTRKSATIAEAGSDLKRLRGVIARVANAHGLMPLAVSCHPFSDWRTQRHTDKERYNTLERDLGGVVRRMLICGMHVHVGLDDDELRIDLMNQFAYFLPHLLALSTSSPFWRGEDTGLNSWRLTVFDDLPRTGMPPRFSSWGEYRRSVQVIIDAGMIEDGTKIWWDVRPSWRYPTLEARICDVSPRLADALSIAALIQSTMRMLWRLKRANQRWRIYDRFLVGENRWRAQRYGVSEGLIDFALGRVVPYGALLEELIELVHADAEALGCLDEVKHARAIVAGGTSADRQRAVYAQALAAGAAKDEALKEVVRSLGREFLEGVA
jgi:carboxylate-amine ligase